MKIYLVKASFGSYDSVYEPNLKAFTSSEAAEKYANKYARVFNKLRSFWLENEKIANGLESKAYDDKYNDEQWSEIIYPVFEYKIYEKYMANYVHEFGVTWVEEIELVRNDRKQKLKRILK